MVQTVADIIIDMGKHGRGASASLRWLADWLPHADHRTLDENDLARINAYAGDANQLQELLGTIAPLTRPVWFEAAVIADRDSTTRARARTPGAEDYPTSMAAYDRALLVRPRLSSRQNQPDHP